MNFRDTAVIEHVQSMMIIQLYIYIYIFIHMKQIKQLNAKRYENIREEDVFLVRQKDTNTQGMHVHVRVLRGITRSGLRAGYPVG